MKTEQIVLPWHKAAADELYRACFGVGPLNAESSDILAAKDDIPEPPKAEPTLKERDHDAYVQWLNDKTSSEDSAWHAALAYERAEVAKMLPPERSDLSNWDTVAHAAYASTKAIRARCAGGGQQ